MRLGIGTAMIVLIAVLAGFGYLLYGYLDTSEELRIVSSKLAQVEQENQALREQVNNANAEIETLTVQVNDLSQQVLFWQEQARQFEEQNRASGEQIMALVAQNQVLQEQNAMLQQQSIEKDPLKTISAELPEYSSKLLRLGALIPTLPIAIAATYLVTRQQTKNPKQNNQGTRLNNMERGRMVRLSDDEMKAVIKMRRTK